MKKSVAKLFKEYGSKKVKVLKKFHPKSFEKGKTTVAITATRRDLNKCIAALLCSEKKAHRHSIAEVMDGDFYEEWADGKVIKY